MTNKIEKDNCCTMCGEIVPEGRQVCRKCEIAAELNKAMNEKFKGDRDDGKQHFAER